MPAIRIKDDKPTKQRVKEAARGLIKKMLDEQREPVDKARADRLIYDFLPEAIKKTGELFPREDPADIHKWVYETYEDILIRGF